MKIIKAHDRTWKENEASGYMEKYKRVHLTIKVSFSFYDSIFSIAKTIIKQPIMDRFQILRSTEVL